VFGILYFRHTRPRARAIAGFRSFARVVGYGATVWDLLPTYPPRITEHGALGGPTYPPRITKHGAPGVPTYPSRITEHGAGNQRKYSGDQVEEGKLRNRTTRGGVRTYLPLQNYGTWPRAEGYLPTPSELWNMMPQGVPTYPLGIAERWHRNLPSLAKE
jgi:hypothetical protein